MNNKLASMVSDIDPLQATSDIYAEAWTKIEAIEQWAKERKAELKLKMIATIKAKVLREISWKISDDASLRFWLGQSKSVKCISIPKMLQFLIGLDLDSIERCLSANAFKHGEFKKLLKELKQESEFGNYFRTETKDKLECDGPEPKPLPDTSELQSIDERFLR